MPNIATINSGSHQMMPTPSCSSKSSQDSDFQSEKLRSIGEVGATKFQKRSKSIQSNLNEVSKAMNTIKVIDAKLDE